MTNPFAQWSRMMAVGLDTTRTGIKLSETLTASKSVIDTRVGMMKAGLADPRESNPTEMARMVPEKVDAFAKAGSAAAGEWWPLQTALFAQGRALGAMMLRGRAPTAAELARTAEHGLRVAERAAKIGRVALAPVHATATANARRLRKTGR